ncbi:MAG: sodium:proton antiporter [Microbacterium sp.]|uniref:cation:proton antiporter n=1 Tax=Microbacterium sp. TaxID=51671 RepID=UPI00262AAFB3|nr:sodium:proton antiporter [Microbacterium sp.]MCX6501427.1 sodium:proton antiporter [Microbacterium sp.]
MENLIIVVLGVVLIVAVTGLGRRINIAAPLVLVAIGLVLAATPFIPDIPEIDPEWILVGILPPLLYSSAVNLPAVEFRRDFTPIAGLSVLLVVLSSLILGLFFTWAIPDLPFPVGVALGAILSPTDAVATGIVKRMGISPRVVTMLEGESLLNDATALVLLRTATIAIAGAFSWGLTIGTFAWGVLLALIIGSIVGWLNLRVRVWIGNSAANTALSFAVPFIAYIPTEELGGSGLVAAVVAGIVTGQGAARWFTPEQRLSDTLNWRTIELILEGGVFLVMGLELTDVVTRNLAEHDGLWHGTWLALSALGIVLVVRAIYVTAVIWGQGRRARRFTHEDIHRMGERLDAVERGDVPVRGRGDPAHTIRRVAGIRQRLSRMAADLDYYRESPLGWKHGTLIVWAGMRGVVTLAAAQTLPTDTQHRPLLIFVAFLVAIISLLLQGLTLPAVVRLLRFRTEDRDDEGDGTDEGDRVQDELREAAAAALREPGLTRRNGAPFDTVLVRHAGARLTEPPDADAGVGALQMLELRVMMIEVMRRRLVDLTATGRYSTATLRRTLAQLDADQLSLELKIAGDTDE